MSYTVLANPQPVTPAHNPLVYVVSSSNNTNTSFRYIGELFINGTSVKTNKLSPDPNGRGVFKWESIVKSYVSPTLITGNGFFANSNSIVKVECKFHEEYDLSSGGTTGVTVYSNMATGNTTYAWNAALDFIEFASYDANDYVMNGVQAEFNILTNQPSEIHIGTGDTASLSFMASGTYLTQAAVRVQTYNASNNVVDVLVYFNTLTADTTSNRMLTFTCGPGNLNAMNADVWNVSSGTPITSNITKYDVSVGIWNAGSVEFEPLTTNKTYIIDRDYNCKSSPFRFYWLNRLGGYDSFSFKGKNKKALQIKRNEYDKLYGSYSSGSYGYSTTDRGRKVYSVGANEKYLLTSGWLTDAEDIWLEELWTSPEVYGEDMIPVVIRNNDFFPKSDSDGNLMYQNIEFEYAYGMNIQRR